MLLRERERSSRLTGSDADLESVAAPARPAGDIDLERAETQCRAGQDGIARELADIVARLRAELLRCDDTA